MTGPLARRVRSFALPPLLSTLVALTFLPVLARAVDSGAWVALAVGQSVGAVAALGVNLGWTLDGPSSVAALQPVGREHAYRLSLRTQVVGLLVSGPLAVMVATLLSPDSHHLLAATMALAVSLGGLTPTWFNIGVGSPRDIVLFDVLPRTAATLVSLVALATGTTPLVYPACLALAALLPLPVFVRRFPPPPDRPRLGPALRNRVAPAATELAGGSYSSASLALVASQATVAAMAEYTSGARLYGVSLLGITIVSQAFQGWVTEGTHVVRRLRQAVTAQLVVGLVGLLGFVLLGPLATSVLFGERLAASREVMLGLGVAFLAVAVNTATGRHVLVVAGRSRDVFTSTMLGALVGVPAILVLTRLHGAAGGAWALALSEVVVCTAQLAACPRALRTLRA